MLIYSDEFQLICKEDIDNELTKLSDYLEKLDIKNISIQITTGKSSETILISDFRNNSIHLDYYYKSKILMSVSVRKVYKFNIPQRELIDLTKMFWGFKCRLKLIINEG